MMSDDNICRICLKTQDTLFSLFRKRHGTSPFEKLVSKTNLKIELNDSGPSSICSQCLIDLDTTVTFLEKCEHSNYILAARLPQVIDEERCNLRIDTEEFELKTAAESDSQFRLLSITEINDEDTHREVNDVVHNLVVFPLEKCDVCGSKRRCKHWAPPTSHACQYCDKVFNKKFNFQLHIKRHLGAKDWPCPVCGSLQLTGSIAQRHCQPKIRRRCTWPGCGKSFTTNTNLYTHVRSHNGERPFECNDCGKKFTSKKTLKDHVRIHTGEKPYVCQVCGKQFTTNHLAAHMTLHVASKAHICARAGCGRRFNSARALRSHSRTHVNVKPFACALCRNKYKFKQSLNQHVKKQHGVKAACQQEMLQKTP